MPKLTNQPKPIDLSNPPPFATVSEVRATIRDSRSTIYRRIQAGQLEAVKIGGSTRIKTSSLIRLLEASASF